MVFTIVTIVFLPMSFIAAFFAINLEDWNGRLTIAYVSKYMFGIGLAISVLFVAAAFLVDDIADASKSILKGAKTTASCVFQKEFRTVNKLAYDADDDLATAWQVRADGNLHPPGTAGGASTSVYRSFADEVEWKRRGVDSRDRHQQYEHARLGLSPIRHGGRKLSFGSGGHNPWTGRPSFDGRRAAARFSGDLERGRAASRSRIHWESAR